MIIQASNINESGGKVLLLDLIRSILKADPQNSLIVFSDTRAKLKMEFPEDQVTVVEVNPTLVGRLLAEVQILNLHKKTKSQLLCFGNLPPLFSSSNQVYLYFHSVLYFKKYANFISNKRLKLKIKLETLWIKLFLKNVNTVIVQSNSVQRLFQDTFHFTNIMVFPFSPQNQTTHNLQTSITKQGFTYPAVPTPHKNHVNLIHAWKLLAQENIYPILNLTVDSRFPEVLKLIETSNKDMNTKIINHGYLTHSDVLALCLNSEGLVFPSFCESLGLPLIEAQNLNIPIIASELDYVRDVATPQESFDPNSPVSIARAIKRFLKINNQASQSYSSSKLADFLKNNTSGSV